MNLKSNIMKKILVLFTVCFLTFSCEEVVDKEPLDMITDAQVWDDPALIDAHLTFLYSQTQNFLPYAGYGAQNPLVNLTDEGRCGIGWSNVHQYTQGVLNPSNANGGAYVHFWPYSSIRNQNEFLEKIQDGNVTDEFRNLRSAEVRYLRAWNYYQLAIRFGGVPLLTVAQSWEDDLFVPRNKEEEIWEFIRTELDEIIEILPAEPNGMRVNKWVALALKSRAMLHAASIAKYGQVQLDGIVGAPASKADFYFTESYNASKEILDNGPYALYEKHADKAKNYQMIFLDESNENKEVIFAEKFVGIDRGHTLDADQQPITYKASVVAVINPTLEMVDEYEFVDGRPGSDIDYTQIINTKELYKDKEPRFHASILYNQAYWIDDTIRTYYFTVQNNLTNPRKNGPAFRGIHVNDREAGATQTGFYMKKFLQEKRGVPTGESNQDFIIFRLGEIYLNHAEAAFQLGGKNAEALESLNAIRRRAGVPEKTEITIDNIKHERRIELAFEGFRMWDARRWRDAVERFSGVVHKLNTYKIASLNTYGYLVDPAEGKAVRLFQEQNYYNPIHQDFLVENPKLIQNPGYE